MNVAVILAGGLGLRLATEPGLPKQFHILNGKPVLIHTLEVFEAHHEIDRICVVCLAEWEGFLSQCLVKSGIKKVTDIVTGGKTRRHSILNALEMLRQSCAARDVILIHDGVRPFVSADLVSRTIAATKRYGSVTAAFHNYEALLLSEDGKRAVGILPRNTIYDIQTPQGFFFELGLECYLEAEKEQIPDDVSGGDMFLALGRQVHMVSGSKANMKLTTRDDMEFLKALDLMMQTRISNP